MKETISWSMQSIVWKGLLTHKMLPQDRKVLLNVKAGYNFFSTWLDRKGTNAHTLHQQLHAWHCTVTVYLYTMMLICIPILKDTSSTQEYLGRVEGFCEDSFKQFPNHYVRAVESLFSQLKFTTTGKLDAVNYRTAQSSLQSKHLKPSSCASNESRKFCVDDPFFLAA